MPATQPHRRSLPCCVIEHSETVENYLKAIFGLSARGVPASTSAIAGRLGVAPASVSAMTNRLQDNSLVEHAGWGRVLLTTHGRVHAVAIVRRHRLLETFLHRVLGLSWDEVHAEAEVLEHGLSERLEDLIDAALGYPDRDPHGDPIPPKTGPHEESGETPLASAAPGDRFLVERVRDHDSAALRDLAGLDIRPGVALDIEHRAGVGGPLWVRRDGHRYALGSVLVDLIHGQVMDTARSVEGSGHDPRSAPA